MEPKYACEDWARSLLLMERAIRMAPSLSRVQLKRVRRAAPKYVSNLTQSQVAPGLLTYGTDRPRA